MSGSQLLELAEALMSTAGTVLAALIAARQRQVKRDLNGSQGELELIRERLEHLIRSRRRD